MLQVWRLIDGAGTPIRCFLTELDGRWLVFLQRAEQITLYKRCSSQTIALKQAHEIWRVLASPAGVGQSIDPRPADPERPGLVIGDRRNYRSRAETVRRVGEWLCAAGAEGTRASGIPEGLTAPLVERVLRRLMIKGLARKAGTAWLPTPPMLHPAPLVRSAERATPDGE